MKLLPLALSFGLPLQPVGQCALARPAGRPRWQRLLGYFGLVLAVALFAKGLYDPPQWWDDFNKAYYPAGQFIFSHPYELYAGTEPAFVNIPIIAVFFMPLSALGLAGAQLAFACLGVLLVGLACCLLLRLTGASGPVRLAIVGLFLLNGPLYYSFREGNLTHYVFFLLVAALVCLESKRDGAAGALLAVAALVKIPLFLFGVYYLLRRRWRVLAGFTVALLVLCGGSLLAFGPDVHVYWFRQCIVPFSGKPLTAYNLQSLSSFLGRLLTDNGIGDWSPVDVGPGFRLLHLALVVLVGGAAAGVCRSCRHPAGPEGDRLEFCITLCLALVTSPISWTHYYLFLILPYALYLGGGLPVPRGRSWLAALALALSLTSPPSGAFCSAKAWARPLLSHYLFGGLLLLGTLLAARRRAGAAVVSTGRSGFAPLRRAGHDSRPPLQPIVTALAPARHADAAAARPPTLAPAARGGWPRPL
jgi:hypothetical protein